LPSEVIHVLEARLSDQPYKFDQNDGKNYCQHSELDAGKSAEESQNIAPPITHILSVKNNFDTKEIVLVIIVCFVNQVRSIKDVYYEDKRHEKIDQVLKLFLPLVSSVLIINNVNFYVERQHHHDGNSAHAHFHGHGPYNKIGGSFSVPHIRIEFLYIAQ
jgi:hypothetical protein